MRCITRTVAAVLVFLQLFLSSAQAAPLLIRNVDVIDGTGSPIQKKRNVLIDAGRILSVTPASNSKLPPGTKIVEASGLTMIPGLWDMHVHWYDGRFLPLFIANGVTGVRQMWGLDMHYAWRAKENDPSFIGPKQLIASVIIDGAPKVWPDSIEVTDPNAAREQVRLFHDKGADFIKVYSHLNRDVYFSIADESKKLGIPFAGHVPDRITLVEASDAGQKSMEHLIRLDIAVMKDPASLRAKYLGQAMTPEAVLAMQEDIVSAEDAQTKAMLFKKFIANGTWQSPTLTVLRNGAYFRERAELDKERLTYLPLQVTTDWLPKNNSQLKLITDERQWRAAQLRFAHLQHLVGEMHKAGVKILAGTDVLNPYCFPGFSLHDELELLVESGLPPMAALQAATLNAAEYSGKLKDLGTVTEGKVADLVLLSADPLADIRNTRKITAVILNGVLHDRTELDAMLKNMQKQANYGK